MYSLVERKWTILTKKVEQILLINDPHNFIHFLIWNVKLCKENKVEREYYFGSANTNTRCKESFSRWECKGPWHKSESVSK